MDVGAGSGILSLFAAQAGAKKVYAVEASKSAENARKLIKANGFDSVITVLEARIEDLTTQHIPEGKVDVIVSEPLGTFLLNERMLETYVIARQLFLKPEGRMFPARADLCIMPFSDLDIFNEQMSKCDFWRSKDFHGLDLSDLYWQAVSEKFA
jgi:histone-arginine methyltransferase CARM1